MEITNLLHTEQVIGPTRSIFLDVKHTEKGNNYLVITQAQQAKEDYPEKTRIVLFENEIAKFSEALMRSLLRFSVTSNEEYREAIKEKYPKAFSKWTEEDEEKLKSLYAQGLEVEKLCNTLERNSGGITARLIKLGLAKEEEVLSVQ